MHLDSQTIAFTAASVVLALSILSAFVLGTQKTYDGFPYWVVANFCFTGGLLLGSLRNSIATLWSILIANALLLVGQICIWKGTEAFRGRRRHNFLIYSSAALTFGFFIYFFYWHNSTSARIVVTGIFAAESYFAVGLLLVTRIPKGQTRSSVLTGSLILLLGSFHLIRIVWTLTQPPVQHLFAPSLFNTLFFLSVVVAAIGWCLGIILLVQERLVQDFKDAESLAARRNAELQTAMKQANALKIQAEQANRAKTDFLANVSHELRTPMNGVLGLAELLLRSELNQKQQQYSRGILQSGNALLDLVNDMLDLSKIEAGKVELLPSAFELAALLEDTSEWLAWKAQEKGVELLCYIDPAVPRSLVGDVGRLRQILINLGGNAVKFTSHGEVRIQVTAEEETDNGVRLRFNVADTGIGIPPERRNELFARFTQLHSSANCKFGGTGLGLAISRELVRLMNGSIGVESEEGRGSTFWFSAQFEKQESASCVTCTPADVPIKILSATRHDLDRKTIHDVFRSLGHRHDTIPDLTQPGTKPALIAIEEIIKTLLAASRANDPYQLLLIESAGDSTVDEEKFFMIQQWPELRGTFVVFMTPLTYNASGKLARESRVAFISKPLRKAALIATTRRRELPDGNSALLPAKPSSADERKRRILLVEDNRINQLVATSMLEQLGCSLTVVETGKGALETLSNDTFDVIFMDCQMPELDGYETTAAIRNGAERVLNPDVPIVAMTASALEQDRERCFSAGMDDYISKPVNLQTLRQILDRWTQGGREIQDGKESSLAPNPRLRETRGDHKLQSIEQIR